MRSSDGGTTWKSPGPSLTDYAAVAQPGQPAGDDRLLLDTQFAFEVYDEATGRVTLGPSVPAGIVTVWSPAFVDANTFFAAGTTATQEALLVPGALGATAPQSNELLRCTLAACTDVGTLPHADTQIVVSPNYATDHTFAMWSGNQVDVTRDGGATFSSIMSLLPGSGPWGITFTGGTASGPQLMVSTEAFSPYPFKDYVSEVDFSSGSPSVINHDVTALGGNQLIGLTWTPDGHLWSTLSAGTQGGRGPICSADLGATWAAHC